MLPLIKRPVFYAPRGPIIQFGDTDAVRTLIDGVCVEAALRKAVVLKIDPEIVASNQSAIDKIKAVGLIKKKKQVQPRVTYFLDLNKDLDELMKGFEEKTRYNIRLAERKGVKVIEDSSEKGIDIFYKLYEETCKRDSFLIHPRSYYIKLKETLIDRGMANVFIATFNGIPIASVFIFKMGSRVWYMYGASNNEYRNVMPNHALHWHVIKWAKENGYKLYDLWGIPSKPNEKHPLFGVYRFKKGFNGELKEWIGVYDLPFDRLMYNIFDKGVGAYQAIRSLITKGRISDSLSE
jgi:lipid II:glycine glycyltransferase (peptidoglycan interpeptide bridge formation enzyme)